MELNLNLILDLYLDSYQGNSARFISELYLDSYQRYIAELCLRVIYLDSYQSYLSADLYRPAAEPPTQNILVENIQVNDIGAKIISRFLSARWA